MGRCVLVHILDSCVTRRIRTFKGFTAIVNKQLSTKYDKLVNSAPKVLESMPWGKDFEVDVFKKPDFTALEIVTFTTGGRSFPGV